MTVEFSKKKDAKGKSKDSKMTNTILGAAIGAGLLAAGLVFMLLMNMYSTATYYVLGKDVPARSQITAEMLVEVVVNKDAVPLNAFTPGALQENPVYAKFALNAGDIVTVSNTSGFQNLTEGLPADFVVASFTADPLRSVAGKLETGNYIDIIATDTDEEASSKMALRRVLLIDVSTDPSNLGASEEVNAGTDAATPTDASTQDQMREGVPSLYTVTLSREDAVKLASIQDKNLFVVLSSAEDAKNGVQDDSPVYINGADAMNPSTKVGDSGEGTDPSFGQIDAGTNPAVTEGAAQQ